MTWTTPRTWTDEELVTANLMNTHIRDNLNYLYAADNGFDYVLDSGSYSTTSTTYTVVDSGFDLSVYTPSGLILVGLSTPRLYKSASLSNGYVAARISGTDYEILGWRSDGDQNKVGVRALDAGSAGTYTISLTWKIESSYTLYMATYLDQYNVFWGIGL